MLVEVAAVQGNRLINALPDKERTRLLNQCERVDLVFEYTLSESDQALEYVYLPETCIIALVSSLAGHKPLGITLIGNETMLGLLLVMGDEVLGDEVLPLHGAMIQNSGTAWRMEVSQFRQQLKASPHLLLSLQYALYRLIGQMSQSLACAHFHQIVPRLARWLLMTQDRAYSDHFHLTHKLLAGILGVRRSGITIAAGVLQHQQLISYHRGDITVLDRPGLEAAACECYGTIQTRLQHH